MIDLHEATPAELVDWDEQTVRAPNGHVYQGLAWAGHRARHGSSPRYLAGSDGTRVLALERRWPLIGGAAAYVPRGPIPKGTAEEMLARLDGVATWLGSHGVDVVATDAEVEAGGTYAAGLARLGFRAIEEIQPTRHRMSLPLPAGVDEATVLAGVSKSTRQRVRSAEEQGIEVVRYDVPGAWSGASGGTGASGSGPSAGSAAAGVLGPGEAARAALDHFFDVLLETGERRHFALGPRTNYVEWWLTALAAGQLVFLEARSPRGEAIAGLILYRHGRRLSTVHSGDVGSARERHPGVMHLLRWRAIQLAVAEGRDEMDLGGTDTAGARHEPRPGEPQRGLYDHKRSFGATWLELAGAHERAIRPTRYLAGRVVAAVDRRLRRSPDAPGR